MTRTGAARTGLRVAAGVAIVFGLLTIFAGGRALFGGAEARAAVGNAVPFVLWFNTFAGFAYVAAGAGLLARRRWAVVLSAAILLATLGVFVAFGIHVVNGGAFEVRTVGAMTLRSVVWLVIMIVGFRVVE
ncbi:hypothetical protein HNP73_001815 [Amaricoccus macauensis]|uniref:Uncharacterized protein n=1 Tax=Amaricoccus macauensis TaxID=57001 RepID=A0A840SG03_9RHOB|nr:hypothetical protein [Amaricoccus macauensis]MBB5221879.1 hypothetical protein [Amaricoccus macauensis]